MTFAALAALTAINTGTGGKLQPTPNLDDLLNNDLPVASKLPYGGQSNFISLPNGQTLTFRANGFGGDGLNASNQLLAMLSGTTTTGAGPLVWNGEPIAEEDLAQLKPGTDGTLTIPVTTKEGKIDPIWKIDSSLSITEPVEVGKAQGLRVSGADASTPIIVTKSSDKGVITSKKFPITSDMKTLDGLRIIGNGDMSDTYVGLKVSIDGGPVVMWARQAPSSNASFETFKVDLSKILERAAGKEVVGQIEVVDGGASRVIGVAALASKPLTAPVKIGFSETLSRQKEVQYYTDDYFSKNKLPGISVVLVQNGELVAAHSVGVRSMIDSSLGKLTPTDPISVGSISKPISCYVIRKLVEEGKITWDMRLRDVFPELSSKYSSTLLDSNLAHLVTHTSGLPFFGINPSDPMQPKNAKAWRYYLLEKALMCKPIGAPGEKFEYSCGIDIAVAMVEKVTAVEYDKHFERYINQELGLRSIRLGMDREMLSSGMPRGHVLDSTTGNLIRYDDYSHRVDNPKYQFEAVGCVTGSPVEIAKLIYVAAGYHPTGDQKLLFATAHETPFQASTYTLGAFGKWWAGLWHAGSYGQEHTNVQIIDKTRSVLLIYTNSNNSNASFDFGKLKEDLYKLVLPQ